MRGLRFAVVGVALAGVLSGCSSQPIGDLAPGECFDFSDATTQVTSVTVVECAKPHRAEVFATFNVALPTFSADGLAAATDDQCLAAFEPYVGYAYSAAKIYYRALMPGADGWDKGARTVVCFVVPKDGTLTGSVKKTTG